MTTVRLRWVVTPGDVAPPLFEAVVSCWHRVASAGGAAGFPVLPVDKAAVRAATAELRDSLSGDVRRLVAITGGEPAGWLVLRLDPAPLTRHWGSLARVQTDLSSRGRGVGVAMVSKAARAAAAEGLEQLRIEVRGGQGLEDFSARIGWTEVGRWPRALRLGPADDRDEVLMVLHLERPPARQSSL